MGQFWSCSVINKDIMNKVRTLIHIEKVRIAEENRIRKVLKRI